MKRQSILIAIVSLLIAPIFARAGGDSGPEWWRNYWTSWHRNNCWPEPFIEPDEASVCTMFSCEIVKGWEMQNLMGEPHFTPDNSKLSPAGMIKLRWILTQNIPEYRLPFVERGFSDDITARRMAAVQQGCGELMPSVAPRVAVSEMRMMCTPSDSVTTTNDWFAKYMRSIPNPQLPAFQSNNGGASGGGGGAP